MLGGLIDITGFVKKFIHKLLVHESELYGHNISDIDIVIRNSEGRDKLFVYSRREHRFLRELTDKEVERILTK
jgi:hypothetical protein